VATTAVQASEEVGREPAAGACAKIRELERALGRKTMEVEILRGGAGDQKSRRCAEGPSGKRLVWRDAYKGNL